MKKSHYWQGDRVEMAYLDCAGRSFEKHAHDEYVIGVNTAGHEKIFIDGKNTEARENDLTLYNPGEVQASHAATDEWSFVSLYVEPSLITDSYCLPDQIAFTKSVVNCPRYAGLLRNGVMDVLNGDIPENEIDEMVAMLLDGLFHLSSDIREPKTKSSCHRIVTQMKERLLDDASQNTPLSVMASDYGVTSVQLVRMFKKEVGLPPFRWRRIRKLFAAKYALKSNLPLSAVAASHGFADQSHFTREFRKMFAITPAAYRRCVVGEEA